MYGAKRRMIPTVSFWMPITKVNPKNNGTTHAYYCVQSSCRLKGTFVIKIPLGLITARANMYPGVREINVEFRMGAKSIIALSEFGDRLPNPVQVYGRFNPHPPERSVGYHMFDEGILLRRVNAAV